MNVRTKSRLIRGLAATTVLALATAPIGCGYFLHPERRGAKGGQIDSATMIMDLLWLLPGVVPGVVALVIDFSSGAIYVRGGTALRLERDGRMAVRLPRTSRPERLDFQLVTSSHRIIARKSALVGPSTPDGQSVQLQVDDATRPHEKIHLEIHTDTGASARLPTSFEVALGG